MAALCFLIAVVLFAIKTFSGHIGSLDLIALGLAFTAAGLLLGGGTVAWVKKRIAE